MSEELTYYALNHAQRKLNSTNPIHGVVLAATQASGSAQLLVANANANQAITGGKITLAQSLTGYAGLNLPVGVDPTTGLTTGDVWMTSAGLRFRKASATETVAALSANVFTGIQTFAASALGGAGARFIPGVAPTAPTDGEFWITASGAFARIGGTTVEFAVSIGANGVTTFNGRDGIITLLSSDVTTALGYTPVNPGAATNTFTGALVISGNLTVNGTLVTLNTTNLDIKDKVIHLNKVAGSNVVVPTGFAGFMIDRGDTAGTPRTQAGLVWDELNQRFTLGLFTNDTTMSAETNLRLASLTATGGISLSTPTVPGNSPVNYLGYSSLNCLYVENNGNTIINSISSVQIIIDAYNNSTSNTFKVRSNTPNTSGGTDLFTVNESGDAVAGRYLIGVQHASLGSAGAAGAAIVADSAGKIPTTAMPVIEADTPSTIPIRASDGTIKADNHASLGTSTAAKSVLVADAAGFLPGAAINPATIPISDEAILLAYLA